MASEQKGAITRQQLLDADWSSSTVGRWIDNGLLVPEYPGVYRFGHTAPSPEATYMAAALAAGDRALLARRAAGHLMRLLKGAAPPPELVSSRAVRIKGLDVTHERRLDRRDGTVWHGIPTTTIARTLVDLAACLAEYELGLAWHQARVLYRTEPEDVEAVLARRPHSKGAATLCAIMRGKPLSLSRLERAFAKLLKDNNLALPETNRVYGGRYVDCRWPKQKLTVELDSYRYHSSRHAWEQDRKRERQARRRGDDFRRFTSDDVFHDPRALLRELRPIIGL
jgi:very-short-patch-repair endonuclease